jgi:energy-coupling factor transporter ATP-binding protein EcfA2
MGNIKITNLKYSYDKTNVIKSINFNLKKNKTLSIIGTPGSGKTTLLRILNNELSFDGEIYINGLEVNKKNKDALNRAFLAVFRDTDFVNEIVINELRYPMENIGINPKKITKEIDRINDFFNLKEILNNPIESLSLNDKTLVKILSYALCKPTYLALDDLLIDLNERTKILLLNYLNTNEIYLINVTSNMEDVLYTDYLLCLYNGISAIDGKTLDVLENEKVLKRLGFNLPFYIDLSIQLKLYGLLKKTCLNKEKMVKNLWK